MYEKISFPLKKTTTLIFSLEMLLVYFVFRFFIVFTVISILFCLTENADTNIWCNILAIIVY